MTTAVDLRGRPYRDLSLIAELVGAELPEPERLDDISVAEFINAGFSVRMNDHLTIGQVVFYGGTEDGYASYPGTLPSGLHFFMTPSKIHDLLGPLTDHSGPRIVAGLGQMRPWDRYVYDDHRLKIDYSLETGLFTALAVLAQ